VGIAGLERSLEPVLTGRPGRETIVKDALGRPIDVVSSIDERKGDDVVLTLDSTLQATAEQVLRETVLRWSAKAATAVVLDPRTGGVLAMATASSTLVATDPALTGMPWLARMSAAWYSWTFIVAPR